MAGLLPNIITATVATINYGVNGAKFTGNNYVADEFSPLALKFTKHLSLFALTMIVVSVLALVEGQISLAALAAIAIYHIGLLAVMLKFQGKAFKIHLIMATILTVCFAVSFLTSFGFTLWYAPFPVVTLDGVTMTALFVNAFTSLVATVMYGFNGAKFTAGNYGGAEFTPLANKLTKHLSLFALQQVVVSSLSLIEGTVSVSVLALIVVYQGGLVAVHMFNQGNAVKVHIIVSTVLLACFAFSCVQGTALVKGGAVGITIVVWAVVLLVLKRLLTRSPAGAMV